MDIHWFKIKLDDVNWSGKGESSLLAINVNNRSCFNDSNAAIVSDICARSTDCIV